MSRHCISNSNPRSTLSKCQKSPCLLRMAGVSIRPEKGHQSKTRSMIQIPKNLKKLRLPSRCGTLWCSLPYDLRRDWRSRYPKHPDHSARPESTATRPRLLDIKAPCAVRAWKVRAGAWKGGKPVASDSTVWPYMVLDAGEQSENTIDGLCEILLLIS